MENGNEIVGYGKRDDLMYTVALEEVDDQALTAMDEDSLLREIRHQRFALADPMLLSEWQKRVWIRI